MRHVIKILDANDLRNGLSLRQLFGSNVAQTNVPDETFSLEFCERGQGFLNRSLRRFRESTNAEIHYIKNIEAKISQIVMDSIDELLAGKSRNPGLVCPPTSANLRDDNEIVGVGCSASRISWFVMFGP